MLYALNLKKKLIVNLCLKNSGELVHGIFSLRDYGVCPTVGVGVHFSSGGYGNMMRKYGLSGYNIIDVVIVEKTVLISSTVGRKLQTGWITTYSLE